MLKTFPYEFMAIASSLYTIWLMRAHNYMIKKYWLLPMFLKAVVGSHVLNVSMPRAILSVSPTYIPSFDPLIKSIDFLHYPYKTGPIFHIRKLRQNDMK